MMATHWTGLPEGDGDKLKACGAASACEVSQLSGRWLPSVSVLREWGRLPLGLPRGILGGVQLPVSQLTRRDVKPGLLLFLATSVIN
ncbi:hypothetical protein LEMLEM_LOCUS7920 [Lemmus lemmus]